MTIFSIQMTSTSTTQHDLEAAKLMHSLRDVQYISGSYTFLWLDTDQACFKHHLNDSWFNPLEARITARVTDAIARVAGDDSIMLVTGYSQQVQHAPLFCILFITKIFRLHLFQVCELRSYFPQEREIPIGTIDEYQGTERNIVIASLVRSTRGDNENSSGLGFLFCHKRAITLLTRGRQLVILVGSRSLFQGSKSDCWRYLLDKASVREVHI